MKNLKSWKLFTESVDTDIDILDPKFTDGNAEEFLTRLGVEVTKSTGEYKPGVPEESNVGIRPYPNNVSYGFKLQKDCDNFEEYVKGKNIKYKTFPSEGARYPYHIIVYKN